jgi:hypothetical protein
MSAQTQAAPLITAPGAYSNISNEDYHRNPNLLPEDSLSASGMKTLLSKSPRHFWHGSAMNPNRPAEKDKAHYSIGKATHDVLLLEDRWPTHYHVLPADFNGNATKAQAEWHAEREAARDAGKVILKHDEAQTVLAMAASLRANKLATALLTHGESEVTLAWQDEKTGVWLRARPDFLPHKKQIIPDLKTCADGSEQGFSRAISNNGYAIAAAVYLEGIRVIFGEADRAWVHIAIEKEDPHVCALWQLPPEDILRGHHLFRRAVNIFADCQRSGVWPGYADEPAMCGLPGWERKNIDDGVSFDGVTHHQKEWMEES